MLLWRCRPYAVSLGSSHEFSFWGKKKTIQDLRQKNPNFILATVIKPVLVFTPWCCMYKLFYRTNMKLGNTKQKSVKGHKCSSFTFCCCCCIVFILQKLSCVNVPVACFELIYPKVASHILQEHDWQFILGIDQTELLLKMCCIHSCSIFFYLLLLLF